MSREWLLIVSNTHPCILTSQISSPQGCKIQLATIYLDSDVITSCSVELGLSICFAILMLTSMLKYVMYNDLWLHRGLHHKSICSVANEPVSIQVTNIYMGTTRLLTNTYKPLLLHMLHEDPQVYSNTFSHADIPSSLHTHIAVIPETTDYLVPHATHTTNTY